MKQINLFKNLFLGAILCATGVANAQIHPLAFGSYTLGTTATNPNWYADYVGLRFEVVSPSSDAGTKSYTTAYSGTTPWGGQVTSPIVNVPIQMPQAGDSLCGSSGATITPGLMTGKIGLVYRGGGIDFGDKAYDCQNAGAIACVIVDNAPGGPVGMAEAGHGSLVTIPIFMISQADGNVLDSLYNAGIIANLTITPWGQGYLNDLGFVPGGAAMWHAYAIPSNQLGTSGNPPAYNMMDGAFIANYGLNPATGVKLKSSTTFTPTGGIAGTAITHEVDLASTFTPLDSIYAMFSTTYNEYQLSASGTGMFTTTYVIESDSIDQYPADNTTSVSFYTTDTVFSKGAYDFTTNQPQRALYEAFGGGVEFLWGPMYYIANSTFASGVQYALAMNSTTTGYPYLPTSNNIYIFKWNDGAVLADSIVQDGELELVGAAVKNYDGVNDTSEALLYQQIYSDTTAMDLGSPGLALAANSWYCVCIDVPATTFLGCDGVNNPYPRVYGRYQQNVGGSGNHLLDYSGLEFSYSTVGTTRDSLFDYDGYGVAPVPAGQTAYVNSVDSFVYSDMVGLIPAVALTTTGTLGVKTISKPIVDVSLFPNPAKDELNVSVSFNKNEPTVSYEIIDGLARFVSKETHTNVQNETYTINTTNLAPGHYYLMITAEGKITSRKFVVVK